MSQDATLALATALIERASVTPEDAGCQQLLGERLEACGFKLESMRFEDVDNLWAVAGDVRDASGPLLCFAGHTDVVPPGNLEDWANDPFEPLIVDGLLYGRGAADMKGSLAAMVTAAERFRAQHPNHSGRLAFLLTSDEEGPSIHGTREVIQTLQQRGEQITWCVVGEPSSQDMLGDTIKNGRRGSLGGKIMLRGKQGHVAYPQLADNALHRLVALLTNLIAIEWDQGDEYFPPTTLQISNLQAGTGADNVIPGRAQALFNLRYSPALNPDKIRQQVEALCAQHAAQVDIEWRHSGEPFITESGQLLDAAQAAVADVSGHTPTLSTAGGTSDGRFIAPTGAQVLELGPINASIHQADEHVRVDDLTQLSAMYEGIMRRLLTT